jgi:hypothetical protein
MVAAGAIPPPGPSSRRRHRASGARILLIEDSAETAGELILIRGFGFILRAE